MGDLDPHLIHGSLGPPDSTTQTASRSVQTDVTHKPTQNTVKPADINFISPKCHTSEPVFGTMTSEQRAAGRADCHNQSRAGARDTPRRRGQLGVTSYLSRPRHLTACCCCCGCSDRAVIIYLRTAGNAASEVTTAHESGLTLDRLLVIMAAPCNRAGHYIFALWFLSFFFFLSFFLF